MPGPAGASGSGGGISRKPPRPAAGKAPPPRAAADAPAASHGQADYSTEALCGRILRRHRDSIATRRDSRAIEKLARIATAALALSNRGGFHAMSLRQLSEKSGVSMGGLYSYFRTKNELLAMLLTEVAATSVEVLGRPPAQVAEDPRAHLRWLVDTHIRMTEAMQPWFVFAYMEAKSFPVSARRMAVDSERATEAMFLQVLRSGAEQGLFTLDDPDLTAALIKPLLQDWYVKRGKYRRRGVQIDTYIAAVQAMVEAACGAQPPDGPKRPPQGGPG